MKLYNKDKNKGKFQSLETLQKKEMIMIFQASFIIKRPYKIFLLTFIYSNMLTVESIYVNMRQKLNKAILILKFYPG